MKNYKIEREGDAKFDSVDENTKKKEAVLCFGHISIGFKGNNFC